MVPNNIGKRCPVELLGSGHIAQWAKVGPPRSRSSHMGTWDACPSESLRIPQRTSRINRKTPAQVKYFFAVDLWFHPSCRYSDGICAVSLVI